MLQRAQAFITPIFSIIRPVCITSLSLIEAAALLVWSVRALELVGAATVACRVLES
jgi:hypothetical protein